MIFDQFQRPILNIKNFRYRQIKLTVLYNCKDYINWRSTPSNFTNNKYYYAVHPHIKIFAFLNICSKKSLGNRSFKSVVPIQEVPYCQKLILSPYLIYYSILLMKTNLAIHLDKNLARQQISLYHTRIVGIPPRFFFYKLNWIKTGLEA